MSKRILDEDSPAPEVRNIKLSALRRTTFVGLPLNKFYELTDKYQSTRNDLDIEIWNGNQHNIIYKPLFLLYIFKGCTVAVMSTSIESLRVDVDDLKQEKEKFRMEVDDLKQEKEKLREEVDELKKENKDVNARVDELSKRIDEILAQKMNNLEHTLHFVHFAILQYLSGSCWTRHIICMYNIFVIYITFQAQLLPRLHI